MTTAASAGARRPVGVSPGIAHLLFAAGAVYGLVRLTGAVALVVMLGVAAVATTLAAVTGWWRLRSVRHLAVTVAGPTTVGDPVALQLTARRAGGPVHVRIVGLGTELASGWTTSGTFSCDVVFARRGVLDAVEVACTSAGAAGLIWWRRTVVVPVDEPLIQVDTRQ